MGRTVSTGTTTSTTSATSIQAWHLISHNRSTLPPPVQSTVKLRLLGWVKVRHNSRQEIDLMSKSCYFSFYDLFSHYCQVWGCEKCSCANHLTLQISTWAVWSHSQLSPPSTNQPPSALRENWLQFLLLTFSQDGQHRLGLYSGVSRSALELISSGAPGVRWWWLGENWVARYISICYPGITVRPQSSS